MNIKDKKLLILAMILLLSTMSFANKPEWVENAKKPSDYEKREHKEKMTTKNEDKKHKHKHKKSHKKDKQYSHERDYNSIDISNRKPHNTYNDTNYEGQGQTDKEFIEEKTDETKKNWIGKFFNFLN